jgi:NTE family protein
MAEAREETAREPQTAPGNDIVLALGGGGAAGLAHVGVLQALAEEGIRVRAVVGTSIGAEIGAFYVRGMSLEELARLALSFDWLQNLRLFLPDLPDGGLVSGREIVNFLRRGLGDARIETLPVGYCAIAADLESGEQVVIDSGELVLAVRASVSLPGILTPVQIGKRMLVDGGVVNPVPFDVAHARFGGPVVAVAVHSGARRRELPVPSTHTSEWPGHARELLDQPWMAKAPALRVWLEGRLETIQRRSKEPEPYWTAPRVVDRVMDITKSELVRLRALQVAPDLMLSPDVGAIGLLEFYRAREAIDAGRAAVRENLPALQRLATGP